MRNNSRSKSSVIFIDEESLLLNEDAWGEDDDDGKFRKGGGPSKSKSKSKISQTWNKIKSIPEKKARSFPGTFRKYLLSENSVIVRLLSSLLPPLGRFQRVSVDPQGTFLSIFILSAVLYLGFVNSRSITRSNALLSSVMLSLGYVIISTITICLFSLLTKTVITFSQTICVMGYGLFGHALALFICEMGSDDWFIPSLIAFGGLSTIRICFILFARTPVAAFRFVICTPAGIAHLLYLVYLHFSIMKDY